MNQDGIFTIQLSVCCLTLLAGFKVGTLGTFTGAVICVVTASLKDAMQETIIHLINIY